MPSAKRKRLSSSKSTNPQISSTGRTRQSLHKQQQSCSVDWTDAYLDKVLRSREIGSHNRPSRKIVSEAQALHDTFQRGLKMLSLAGQISFPTLKAGFELHHHMITTGHTVGRTPKKYPDNGDQNSSPTNFQENLNEDPHNPSDLTPHLPTFKELVNMHKVKHHFERRAEVSKVVKQFNIEFHLLASSFHPKTTLSKALWMEEYTSCDRWAELGQSEYHLLENFAKEATQCPRDVFKKKPLTTVKPLAVKEQTQLRQELTAYLNQLVAAPGNMTVRDVKLWLKEIAAKRYTVIQVSNVVYSRLLCYLI
ncbi:uncharacterized protein MELLADRAFT_113671 [Melampsora larici-populina 98AG31]|uniref:Uncharacterized protein n=1 Tax=Melampsora larici-populina (strain 98AG31 / pathotype 3-4-7) TaxID=747676 RepID=F4SAP8_MELLP|nr:uncharacterized protein MELLADRAFT_113671 [Melampsora larici-populina 98AG31]EGF98281.1 hypothetical protein MELLADRAFT_113671 [Melampsora larici-populina 98AG31]